MNHPLLCGKLFRSVLHVWFFVTLIVLAGFRSEAQTIRYVKQSGTGDGSSWITASGDLQAMINTSAAGNEVWVAAGEYQPASGQSFTLKEGVKIYGGFPASGNPDISNRNYAAHVSILKGNNASVVSNNGNLLTNASVLDGFTITGGRAGEGGGIYNQISSPYMRNLTIKGNTATSHGGGVCLSAGTATFRLENSLITGNTAAMHGGGIYALNSTNPVIVNVTISANTAGSGGSGVTVERSNLTVQNSIVWGNNGTADNFRGPASGGGGAAYIAYSLIQGSGGSDNWQTSVGRDNGYNIDKDPLFTNVVEGNYALPSWSPAINAGDKNLLPGADSRSDLSANPRVYANGIDIGAYEYHGAIVPTNNRLYVRKGSAGTGSSWEDALGELADALKFAKEYDAYWSGENTFQVWAAGGTYKPLYSPDDDNFGNPDGQHNAFRLVDHVQVYGGFAGTESTLRERNLSLTANASILSGDFNDDDLITETNNVPTAFSNTNENAFHVVVAAGSSTSRLGSDVVLDGFTISGGNAYTIGNGATVSGNNISMAEGGGIYNLYSDMVMSNLVFIHNKGYEGGGINNLQSSPEIKQVKVIKNYADWGGGVMNRKSSPQIKNSQIEYNAYYTYGGGIYNFQSSPLIDSVKIVGNWLSGSIASSTGGGLHNRESNGIRMKNVLIESNFAYSGAAICNASSSTIIENSVLRGNRAPYDGGGVYMYNSSELELTNCLITGNSSNFGGGVSSFRSSIHTRNTTISGNKAEIYGGGLYARSSLMVVENTIIYGNSSAIHAQESTTVSVKNSNIQGGYSTENGNISEDPLFTEAPSYTLAPFTSGDYTLQACSPVINLGNNSLIPANQETDLAGNPRIYDGTVDMGAHESQSPLAIGAGSLALDGNSATVSIAANELEVKANDAPCRTIATIVPTGDAPVSGNVTATVYIDQTVQFHTGSPYVRRYYDIAPVNGAQTATARITLYFTQDEFDSFNDELSSGMLPASSDDISGKSNLRVFQFHGSSESGHSPSSYTGSLTTIDPADEDIVWNQTLERWEVSFGVTGFSGFFIGSASNPLPVKLVTFQASRTDAETVELQWDVTEQVDIARYEVQYSPNGRNFTIIGNVAATDSEQTTYRFTDTYRAGPVAYYRLQIVEQDGSEELSRIVSIALPHHTCPKRFLGTKKSMNWIS